MLSDKIKQYRKDNKLTQEELADKLFVSRNAVSKWENDNGYPSIETIKDLSKLLNISIDELINDDDKYKKSKYLYYLQNILSFLIYSLIAILIPHIMFLLDPTSVMAYNLFIGPISFIILGLLTPLINKQLLYCFVSSALAIIPTLIYFEQNTKVVIYNYEIVYYCLFIASYCITYKLLKVNFKKNINKIIKNLSFSLSLFLALSYIVLCLLSIIKYDGMNNPAPIYSQPLVYTLIFIIPIFLSLFVYIIFKKNAIIKKEEIT
ncbi:MAG: helix-turn-helix domain-containing protein [Erysipelotrichaceae bacterium]|nr:helix-turn-helix domain-containing protein [Erysipelotrichaceae bacterium]